MDTASYREKIQKLIDKCEDHTQKLKNLNESFAQNEKTKNTLKNEYYSDDIYSKNGENFSLETVFDSDEIYELISSYESEKIKLLKNIVSTLED